MATYRSVRRHIKILAFWFLDTTYHTFWSWSWQDADFIHGFTYRILFFGHAYHKVLVVELASCRFHVWILNDFEKLKSLASSRRAPGREVGQRSRESAPSAGPCMHDSGWNLNSFHYRERNKDSNRGRHRQSEASFYPSTRALGRERNEQIEGYQIVSNWCFVSRMKLDFRSEWLIFLWGLQIVF